MSYPAGERLVTLAADESSGDKVGIMIALEVHVQELFLAESLVTLTTSKRLFPCVSAFVHYHVALLQGDKRFTG